MLPLITRKLTQVPVSIRILKFPRSALRPGEGGSMSWASYAISKPMPISYKLSPFMEIFNNSLFNLSQLTKESTKIDIGKFKANLQKAFDISSTEYLKKKGILNYCSPD
jgi:hypothetical protein